MGKAAHAFFCRIRLLYGAGRSHASAHPMGKAAHLVQIFYGGWLPCFGAFYWTGLRDVVVEEGITKLWDNVFDSCDKLTSVRLPSTLTEIGVASFRECPNLKTINYMGSRKAWQSISIGLHNEDIQHAIIRFNYQIHCKYRHHYGAFKRQDNCVEYATLNRYSHKTRNLKMKCMGMLRL